MLAVTRGSSAAVALAAVSLLSISGMVSLSDDMSMFGVPENLLPYFIVRQIIEQDELVCVVDGGDTHACGNRAATGCLPLAHIGTSSQP